MPALSCDFIHQSNGHQLSVHSENAQRQLMIPDNTLYKYSVVKELLEAHGRGMIPSGPRLRRRRREVTSRTQAAANSQLTETKAALAACMVGFHKGCEKRITQQGSFMYSSFQQQRVLGPFERTTCGIEEASRMWVRRCFATRYRQKPRRIMIKKHQLWKAYQAAGCCGPCNSNFFARPLSQKNW